MIEKMNTIKFKKVTFNVQLKNGKKKETTGYLFNIDGLDYNFVAHRRIDNESLWVVSEHLTGTLVSRTFSYYTTRKKAVNETIKRLIPKLVDKLPILVDKVPHVNKPIK